jgi:hypothetical protein
MSPDILSKSINSIGLFLDIVGAWFVAWEVVRQYKGNTHGISMAFGDFVNPSPKTKEYKSWVQNKYLKMKIGLGCLTIGFMLQIASNWVYLPDKNSDMLNIIPEIKSNIMPDKSAVENAIAPPKQTRKPEIIKPMPAK